MTGLRVMVVGAYPVDGIARGGVESATGGLVAALALRPDIESILVVSLEPRVDRVEQAAGDKVRIVRVPAQRLALVTRGFKDLVALRGLAGSFGPDIIHGQGVGRAGDLATRLGLPCVVTVHGMAHLEERALVSGTVTGSARVALVEKMVYRVLARADAVISISEYDRVQLPPPESTPSYVIPNAVRSAFFDVEDGASQPVALHMGGVIRRKNVLGLMQAFGLVAAQAKDARLLVAGGSPDEEYDREVRAAAASLGDSVEMLGAVDLAGLLGLLAESRCVVLFSHQETLPCAIAEAMAAGRPVVATDVGGIREMVEDGVTGYVVADGDGESLATAIVRCLGEVENARRMGSAGRSRAQRFHPDRVAADTIDVYRRVLATWGQQ